MLKKYFQLVAYFTNHANSSLFLLTISSCYTQGRLPKPAPIFAAVPALIGPVEEAGAGDVPHAVPVITNAVAINDWELNDFYGMFLIYNTCDATTQQLLLTCRTSFEMWTRLETQYLQRAADNMHLIHLEFMNKRYTV